MEFSDFQTGEKEMKLKLLPVAKLKGNRLSTAQGGDEAMLDQWMMFVTKKVKH
jgi:hypothetical protein